MKKITFFLCALLISAMSFAETYSHTFNSGELETGTVTLSGVSWATTMEGSTYYGWDSNASTSKGIQLGKSKEACTSYSLTTSHFADYMVTNITVNASTASSGTAKMQVSVGGVDYIAQTALTTSATDYTGAGSSSGDVVISFTNTAKAFYIKSISITYQAVSADEGMILVDQFNVDFGKVTKTKTIVVTGQNLTSAITTSLKEGANFTVTGNLTAEGGELTVNYIATEAGKHTDVLVLTSDDVTTEVALAGEVVVLEGAGTKENPYTVADVIALGLTDKTQAWVEGYIIGTMKDNALEETPSQYSNIVLAAAADVKENYVPVALESGTNPRAALNVVDNPTMLGAKVAVYGTLETYFSKPGVKNVSDYEILSTVTPEPVMFTVTATAENGTVEGAGDYEEGTEATLTATPAEGYEFVNWTSGETEVSTANPFTFTVTSDTTLVANFKEVEPVKLYLNAKDWGYGDARFAAYFFDPAKWVDMTKVEGETYIYEVEVPAGYTKVIFVRMNGSTTENNWDNKWNQTGNLDIPTDGKNMFKPDGWDGKTTTWSTYTPSVKYTFTKGSTWYIDFSAITGKKGANYPKANVADIDYSANAGGTVIPVTFTADVTWAEGATFIKTEQGDWAELKFTTPTEGANCAQVAADGKSYTWTTYVPVVIYTVTATAENGTVEGAGDYEEGTEVTLTATAAEGYEFVNWTKGEEVVSTENPYTFVVTADVALVANFAVVEPEVIAYELNGGELVVEVPTQEELWASFKTAAGLTTLGTLAEITEAGAGKPHSDQDNPCACRIICAKLLDANVNAIFALPEWAWLKAYIMTVQSGLPEASSAAWRYAIAAFFLQSEHSAWPASADFSEAGKPEAWGAAYEAAHAVVLPTEPVAEDYVLPTPVKDGFTFVGWYDNAEGTGEAYTVIPAGWSGTLYAIWKQNPTTALENIAVEGKAVKAIINGQLIIIKNGVQYDAQGQVVK